MFWGLAFHDRVWPRTLPKRPSSERLRESGRPDLNGRVLLALRG